MKKVVEDAMALNGTMLTQLPTTELPPMTISKHDVGLITFRKPSETEKLDYWDPILRDTTKCGAEPGGDMPSDANPSDANPSGFMPGGSKPGGDMPKSAVPTIETEVASIWTPTDFTVPDYTPLKSDDPLLRTHAYNWPQQY